MSFTSPAYIIPRESVVGEEAEWAKMFDPPTASPATPELLSPTNPVPEVMLAAGFRAKSPPPTPSNGTCSTGLFSPPGTTAEWTEILYLRGPGQSLDHRHLSRADPSGPPGSDLPWQYPVAKGRLLTPFTGTASNPPPSTTGWDTAPWSWGLTPTSGSPTSSAPISTTATGTPCSISSSGSSA